MTNLKQLIKIAMETNASTKAFVVMNPSFFLLFFNCL